MALKSSAALPTRASKKTPEKIGERCSFSEAGSMARVSTSLMIASAIVTAARITRALFRLQPVSGRSRTSSGRSAFSSRFALTASLPMTALRFMKIATRLAR